MGNTRFLKLRWIAFYSHADLYADRGRMVMRKESAGSINPVRCQGFARVGVGHASVSPR